MTELFPHLLFICLCVFEGSILDLYLRSWLSVSQLFPGWVKHKLRTWVVACSNTFLSQVGNKKKTGLAWQYFPGKNKSLVWWRQWHLTGQEVDPILKGLHPKCEASAIQLFHPWKIRPPLVVARPLKKEKMYHIVLLVQTWHYSPTFRVHLYKVRKAQGIPLTTKLLRAVPESPAF